MQEEIRARLPKYQRRTPSVESRITTQSEINQAAVTLLQQQHHHAQQQAQHVQHQQQQAAAAVNAANAVAAFQDQQHRQQAAALNALQQQQQRYQRPPVMVPTSAAMSVGSMGSMALMAPLMRPAMALAPGLIHGGNMMRPPPMGLPPGKCS